VPQIVPAKILELRFDNRIVKPMHRPFSSGSPVLKDVKTRPFPSPFLKTALSALIAASFSGT
jgi:hypothetical protein